MCRNIRPLNNFAPPATSGEIEAAALQYVRKIAGTTHPSQANAAVFEAAVAEVAAASTRLLDALVTTAPPKDREVEAAKARARSAARYASCRGGPAAQPSRSAGDTPRGRLPSTIWRSSMVTGPTGTATWKARMAQREVITDDLTGESGARPVRFALDGEPFDIDLTPRNASRLKAELAPYIRRARPAGRPSRPLATRVELAPDATAVRRWADANGIALVKGRRIPDEVVARFRAAGY